jgi:MoaA/NifB/PqqE/SkfB family radical SAM enzyme
VGLAAVILPGKLDRYIQLLEFCREHDLLTSGGELAPVGAAEEWDIVSEDENKQIRGLLKSYPKLTFDWGLSYFLKCGCPAGKEKIGITCNGDVIGCSLNPISFGNVVQEPLKKIWSRMGEFSQYKKFSSRCLSAGDLEFINNYIAPIKDIEINPVYYREHPSINEENERELFRK